MEYECQTEQAAMNNAVSIGTKRLGFGNMSFLRAKK
jgi:hypothetical protein